MKRLIISIIACLFSYISTNGQEYFQQEVNTTLKVKLNDKNHTLSAFERIEYINHSPDTLNFIYLHLWPNAYSNNSTAMGKQNDENGDLDFHFADSIDRGFIDSLDFKINGETAKVVADPDHVDIVKLHLNSPLAPEEKLTITTPFRIKIPLGIYSRLGHIGESYQITQWFPKPAVYDKNGWHPIPYLSQGEFFSEYGSYDVEITVPKNYVVGATGDLVDNQEEIDFLNSRAEYTLKQFENNKIPVYNKAGYPNMRFPESSSEFKTLYFHQSNVHDFAWFADKRYHVLKGEVELPHSKRKVTTWAMFTNNEADLWEKSIEYLNDATYYYSLWNGDYPYNHVTAVDGSISAGGGMEYPNITVIGESYTDFALEQVIVHEVGHNWFYGILGSNERIHAWMDEGLNTFNENRYTETKYPEMKMDALGLPNNINEKLGLNAYGIRGLYDLGYLMNARRNYDQAIETSSEDFTSTNYGAIVYGKTGIGFDYLLAYLGDDLFDRCMHIYFDTWKFKHPHPMDIRNIFEKETGKDLSWFFDDYIKTTKKIDYAISGIKKTEQGYSVKVKNKEGIAGPFSLTALKNDTIIASKWYDGFHKDSVLEFPSAISDKIVLDLNMDIPELDRTDDVIKTSGLFKKVEKISIEFLGSIEDRNKSSLYYFPLIGWNSADKIMPGISLYNHTFPEKKLEWLIAPMYSTGKSRLSGSGFIHYNAHPDKFFRKATYGLEASMFGLNKNIYPSGSFNVELDFRDKYEAFINLEIKQPLRSKTKHVIKLRTIATNEYSKNYYPELSYFESVDYIISNRQILRPANIKFNYLFGAPNQSDNFSQISFEGNMRLNYNIYLKGIDFRIFGGTSLVQNTDSRYNFKMAGQNGDDDYLYDRIFLGRNDDTPSLLSQQANLNHGGFKTGTSIGSNQWLLGANIKLESPIGPVGLFADAGVYPYLFADTDGSFTEKTGFVYDFGVYLPISKDIFEIYIPMSYSSDINSEIEYNNLNFWQRIRFVLNINHMNPFKLMKDIKP